MAKIAFVFPGQGSQKVGMGADFLERYPRLRERYFARADEVLGFGLTDLCLNGPEEDLRRTDNTQPAIFVMSMAVLDVLEEAGVAPDAAAGHSLGEYSALVAAGVLAFPDALRLVRRRGELMASVNERTPGAMAAIIGLDPARVDEVCGIARIEGGVVEAANYNEPAQTVISGETQPVARACALAEEAGAIRVVPLPVGAPFHCSLMRDLEVEFALELDKYEFSPPRIPVVANVTGDYVDSVEAVKDCLRRQLAGSVRWADTVRRLADDGFDTFVEVGPGRVLTGFGKKITPDADLHSAGDVRRVDRLVSRLVG